MMNSVTNAVPFADDKYAKFASKSVPAPFQKYDSVLGVTQKLVEKAATAVSQSFGLAFSIFMIVGATIYFGDMQHLMNAASIILEVVGLLTLRHKIQVRGSAKGISGMTMIMYAVVYAMRLYLQFKDLQDLTDLTMDGMFTIVPLLLVCDILKSVFVKYRSSYEAELDVLQAKYLIPGCVCAALLLRPNLHFWSTSYSIVWSSCLYMDVLALVPQVVMMSRSGGKIEAPIAHFVAATFFSRMEDLWDTIMYHSNNMSSSGDVLSARFIICVQVVHLLLVADFMYYYLKARAAGKVDLQLTIDV